MTCMQIWKSSATSLLPTFLLRALTQLCVIAVHVCAQSRGGVALVHVGCEMKRPCQ